MLSCDEAAKYLVRLSAEDDGLDAGARATIEAHLQTCAECRAALQAQRDVAAWLRSRPGERISDEFTARLAERLDDVSGWLGLADWRAWTLRLAPVAALLALFVLLGSASSDVQPTLEEWTTSGNDSTSAASYLLKPDVTSESLMESLVTGELPAASEGAGNVRQ